MTTRASSAVKSGSITNVTSTLTAMVNVKAGVKTVDIPLQHTHDNHSDHPAWRMRVNTARPCHAGDNTSNDTAAKKRRQKLTSKLRGDSSCRITTLAFDHISATMTMRSKAPGFINFMQQKHKI